MNAAITHRNMKIYVNQDNQQRGPFTTDQVRELVYSGDVKRSALVCTEGTSDWIALETLLNRQEAPTAAAVPPAIAISIERLRDRKEKTALMWLYIASAFGWLFLISLTISSMGLLLPIIGLGVLITFIGELWFAAYLKTNAVRVSEKQLPELHRVVVRCCERLGMPPLDVYVMQHNIWNAFATKIWGRRMVVLLSGAVDSILLKGNMQQMAWLVGHELGHHRAGHLDFSRKLANLGDWCIWLKLWYSRRAELTCDRAGLYCAGSLEASQLALINATVGAQLAAQVNVEEAVRQWHQHRNEFFVKYRTLYATHPHHLARIEHLAFAAVDLGIGR
jgi:Zn-dependent protease with chaperone function